MTSGTLVLGLLNGLIIACLAVGFVLVYKANRFLNLADAQLGVLSACCCSRWSTTGVGTGGCSFVGAVAVGIATGLLVERFFVGPVRRRTKAPVRLLILTIGVSQVLLALTYIPGLAPTSQAPFPQPFNSNVQIGGVVLSGMSLLTLIAVPVLFVLLMGLPGVHVGGQADPSGGGKPGRGAAVRDLGESRQPGHLGDRWRPLGVRRDSEGATTTSFNAEAPARIS